MPQLFARQARQAIGELQVVGIGENQAERGRRRLLLAIRVIDEQLAPALAGDLEPALRRRREQDVAQRSSSISRQQCARADAKRCDADIFAEQRVQQLLIRAQVFGQQRDRRVGVHVDDGHRRLCEVGLLAHQHLVEDHAEAVQIAALVERWPCPCSGLM